MKCVVCNSSRGIMFLMAYALNSVSFCDAARGDCSCWRGQHDWKSVMDVTNEIVVVRCVIENEIGHNTTLIAEGHYDLHRKLG